jgi:8-amino-7-oxononanoate synthase
MKDFLNQRSEQVLREREEAALTRITRAWGNDGDILNLADNDYLGLASHPEVKAAAREAIGRFGCSASSAPLVTGFRPPHEELVNQIAAWYSVSADQVVLWNSGYAANRALLGLLPQKGDYVFADRLVHQSMLAGILASGARFSRYRHLDLVELEGLLRKNITDRLMFVATETVFGMDGDSPDLNFLANLREKYGFVLILDEAHALGWYGPKGAGLAEHAGVLEHIDVLVGTLGKALGSQGAFTIFRNTSVKRLVENFAAEYVYSTFLAPANAAAASKAVEIAENLECDRPLWRASASALRQELEIQGLQSIMGDSPVVPILVGEADLAMRVAENLERDRLKVVAIRPPTVPVGAARLRMSYKAGLSIDGLAERLAGAIN